MGGCKVKTFCFCERRIVGVHKNREELQIYLLAEQSGKSGRRG